MTGMGSFFKNRWKLANYISGFIKLNNIYPCWFPCNIIELYFFPTMTHSSPSWRIHLSSYSAAYQENIQNSIGSATQGTHMAYWEKAPQKTCRAPGLRGPSSTGSGWRHDNNVRGYLGMQAPHYKRQPRNSDRNLGPRHYHRHPHGRLTGGHTENQAQPTPLRVDSQST